jgi:hypothetical protein
VSASLALDVREVVLTVKDNGTGLTLAYEAVGDSVLGKGATGVRGLRRGSISDLCAHPKQAARRVEGCSPVFVRFHTSAAIYNRLPFWRIYYSRRPMLSDRHPEVVI